MASHIFAIFVSWLRLVSRYSEAREHFRVTVAGEANAHKGRGDGQDYSPVETGLYISATSLLVAGVLPLPSQ